MKKKEAEDIAEAESFVERITIRQLRIKKGITQKEMAELLEISLKSYQTYEKDITQIEMGYLFQICDVLCYPIEQIQI